MMSHRTERLLIMADFRRWRLKSGHGLILDVMWTCQSHSYRSHVALFLHVASSPCGSYLTSKKTAHEFFWMKFLFVLIWLHIQELKEVQNRCYTVPFCFGNLGPTEGYLLPAFSFLVPPT